MTEAIAIIIPRELGLRLLHELGTGGRTLSEQDAGALVGALFQFFGPADGDGRIDG